MQNPNRSHLPSGGREGAYADQGAGAVVDAHETILRREGRGGRDRLPVSERRRRRLVEGDGGPVGERGLGRLDARPERLTLAAREIGPRDGGGEREGADARADAAADVVCVGRQPEADGHGVFLFLIREVGHELRRLAEEDRQHAGRRGVQRARVADAVETEPPAGQRDGIERRRAGPLVHDEDAGAAGLDAHRAAALPGGASAARTAVSTARWASASGPGTVQPAALRWPPPPNCAAIRWTSTSPLPRRLTFTSPPSSRKRHATRTVAIERG